MKPFYLLMMRHQNKLERLSLESIYVSLILACIAKTYSAFLWIRSWPHLQMLDILYNFVKIQ
jgi:hypothetical protein